MKHCSGPLPTEIFVRIFKMLNFEDMQSVRLVCRRWASIATLTEQSHHCIVLRLTPLNCDEVIASLSADPPSPTLRGRLRNVRLVKMDNRMQIKKFFDKASNYVRSLHLISTPKYFLTSTQMVHLRELRLDEITYLLQTLKFDYNWFPNMTSLQLENSLASALRQAFLQLLGKPGAVPQIEQLKVELVKEEQTLLLNVLDKHASVMKYLEINYFSTQQLQVAQWKQRLPQFKKLEHLRLSGGYSNEWLCTLFEALSPTTPLRHVDLSGCVELEDTALNLILQKLPKALKKLNLMICSRVTGVSIGNLYLQSNLTTLNLAQCSSVSGCDLVKGIAGCRNNTLRKLVLSEHHKMDEASFCRLIECLPKLEHLDVSSCVNAVTDLSLRNIIRHIPKLRSLDIDYCYNVTDRGLHCSNAYSIQMLQDLHTLSLRGCCRASDFCHALKFQKLQTLKLGYNHCISAIGISSLVQNCPLLEELVVTSCPRINDDAIWYIAVGLKRLRSLNLSNCVGLTQHAVDYIVDNCKKLQRLSIFGIESIKLCEARLSLCKINSFRQLEP